MPYSVDHFLQMVEQKLWDNLSLTHSQQSDLILATPVTYDNDHTWVQQRFVDANLTQMAFTEYCPTYPPSHEDPSKSNKYYVAFSGRPGGPDWYINLTDDTANGKIASTSKKSSTEEHNYESIFGNVVEGREVLDRFFSQKRVGGGQFLKIQSMEVTRSTIDQKKKRS